MPNWQTNNIQIKIARRKIFNNTQKNKKGTSFENLFKEGEELPSHLNDDTGIASHTVLHNLHINQEPSFGDILQYTSHALADYDEQRERTQAQATTEQCFLCDRNGWIAFEDAHSASIVVRCPHDLAVIADIETQKGLKRVR